MIESLKNHSDTSLSFGSILDSICEDNISLLDFQQIIDSVTLFVEGITSQTERDIVLNSASRLLKIFPEKIFSDYIVDESQPLFFLTFPEAHYLGTWKISTILDGEVFIDRYAFYYINQEFIFGNIVCNNEVSRVDYCGKYKEVNENCLELNINGHNIPLLFNNYNGVLAPYDITCCSFKRQWPGEDEQFIEDLHEINAKLAIY